jgi:hypothetical protein
MSSSTSLWAELKRRNVFRVAAAYAVVAWLLIQAADILLGNFGAPDWVFKSFAALLLLGFPLALFLSWAYELTPDGVRRAADVSACMDSSSFARGLASGGRIDCSRVSGLCVVPSARDHDGLFARWLPNGNTGFSPFAESGFCQRRSDLFAVNQTPSQS